MNPERTRLCLDEEALAAHAEGRLLDGPARDAVEMHLADCTECREAASALADALGTAAVPAAPAGFSDRVLARLRATSEGPMPASNPRPAPVLRLSRWAPAAAATVLLAVGALSLLARDGSVPEGYYPPAQLARASDVKEPAHPLDLGADRALGHLSTDKPLYRPGERLMARAVVLDAFTHKPAPDGAYATFEVRGGRGEVVGTGSCAVQSGVAAFLWQVPPAQAGGQFTLRAHFAKGYPTAETTFDVRDYRVPRLKTDLQFLRKAYGPGDEVAATLEATRAEGGIPAGAKVTAVAVVDGKEVLRKDAALDASGRTMVSFALPKDVENGNGTLALSIEDGGVQETAARSIPIVVNRVAMEFFPESGDLVADVPCRVYFEARTPKQDPADVSGRVIDANGTTIAHLTSFHEGRGRFEFTPALGAAYRVVLDQPAGVTKEYALPAVSTWGFSVLSMTDAVGALDTVRVAVASPTTTTATVGLYARERELAMIPIKLDARRPVEVTLNPKQAASGVLRVTVFDAQGLPRAERLVYRRPESNLRIAMTPRPASTVPASKIAVDVVTTDALGRPVAAVLGVAGTDDAVLSTVDPRDRAPRLPTQALLGCEVRELKDAAAYLADGPDGARKTDLLLGTQGWRRFALSRIDWAAGATLASDTTLRVLAGSRGYPLVRSFSPTMSPIDFNSMLANPVFGDGRIDFEDGDRVILGGLVTTRLAPDDTRTLALLVVPDPAGGQPYGDFSGLMLWPETGSGGGTGGYAQLKTLEGWLGRYAPNQTPSQPLFAFAHEIKPDRPAGGRSDFTETVYWHPALTTDAQGKASFTFDASDAVTTIRLRADGVTADGALGSADATVEVRRPFYAEPKFPLEVTAGDRIDLPVALTNGTDDPLSAKVDVELGQGLALAGGAGIPPTDLPARGSARAVIPIEVRSTPGVAKIRVKATAGSWSDDVTREIRIVPAGFPVRVDVGGILEKVSTHEFSVPMDVVAGSVETEGAVYPSPLASLTGAVAALLSEPGGCFEQTSSTNYPNVMALRYMKSHADVDPALIRRAAGMVERGYKRLASFECKKGGFEWFGSDPAHEALTAYGLLEFTDMASVTMVDADMLARTRAWLLSKRDGQGGFRQDGTASHAFGHAPKDVTNAYILWALVKAGEKGLDAEMAAAKALAAKVNDPYVLALLANVLWKTGDREASAAVLDRLAKAQGADGVVEGATTSITVSGGEGLKVETTALAVLAWLPSPDHVAHVEKAMHWLAGRCKGGSFGSTQATILALEAIVAYDSMRARPRVPGTVSVLLDGSVVHTASFPAGQESAIEIPDLGAKVGPGPHRLEMRMEGGADMPYAFGVRFHARTPDSSAAAKVEVKTSLAKATATEGDPVDVPVTVRNRGEGGIPMVVAIVGLPGGLEARPEALKELVRAGTVDAFETRGREVVLYWRSMAPAEEKRLTLACLAAVPGEYTGPASRAYLYYTAEDKIWAPGLALEIVRR